MFEIFVAFIMGIIEGITEWLPISSTGHMILAEQFLKFGFEDAEAFTSMFRVVVQLGAILAVVLIYFERLWPFCRPKTPPAPNAKPLAKALAWCDRDKWLLWAKILVASVPAAVIGIPIDNWLEEHFYNAPVVAMMLILYGVLFIVIENRRRRVRVRRMDEITFKDALIIGFWQLLAVIPGTSRSGATIVGGMLLGTTRPVAAQFTFYLAIPAMVGASGLKLVKYLLVSGGFTGLQLVTLLVGTVVSFVVSVVAIRFLMSYVKKHTFKAFGWYRIFLGVLVLAVFFWQQIL